MTLLHTLSGKFGGDKKKSSGSWNGGHGWGSRPRRPWENRSTHQRRHRWRPRRGGSRRHNFGFNGFGGRSPKDEKGGRRASKDRLYVDGGHIFARLVTSVREATHPGVFCTECCRPISGVRYTPVHHNCDLCESCQLFATSTQTVTCGFDPKDMLLLSAPDGIFGTCSWKRLWSALRMNQKQRSSKEMRCCSTGVQWRNARQHPSWGPLPLCSLCKKL